MTALLSSVQNRLLHHTPPVVTRLPKTRSMDNLLSAFENGLPLTRTSSDPNLNQHCQEGRVAPEPVPSAQDHCQGDGPEPGLLSASGLNLLGQNPAVTSRDSSRGEEDKEEDEEEEEVEVEQQQEEEESCLTTQPLRSPPLHPALLGPDVPANHTPVLQQAPPQTARPPLPPPPLPESPSRTAPHTETPPLVKDHSLPLSLPEVVLGVQQPMEDSTETLTDERESPPAEQDLSHQPLSHEEQTEAPQPDPPMRREVSAPPPSDCQLSDLSLLGPSWEGVRGLVQSSCSPVAPSGPGRASSQTTSYQSRRLAGKLLLRSQSSALASGAHCCYREAGCCRVGATAATLLNGYSVPAHLVLPPSLASPSMSGSPPPPAPAPAYLDDDGLPVPVDAVQQRLRQIEASYKQEVEVLRQQVRQLQMRLESKQFSTPPSEPDVDYEDDIVSCSAYLTILSLKLFQHNYTTILSNFDLWFLTCVICLCIHSFTQSSC